MKNIPTEKQLFVRERKFIIKGRIISLRNNIEQIMKRKDQYFTSKEKIELGAVWTTLHVMLLNFDEETSLLEGKKHD